MFRIGIQPCSHFLRRPKRDALGSAANADWQDPKSLMFRDGRNVGELSNKLFAKVPDKVMTLGERANDCGSYCLDYGDKKLKCFETLSSVRAQMVRRASNVLLEQGVMIPRVLAILDHVVFSEWIDGELVSNRSTKVTWDSMATYQARIHNAVVSRDETTQGGLLHLNWLLERLRCYALPHVGESEVLRVCEQIIWLAPRNLQTRVMMPDFLPSNLVEDTNGQLVCIDNEFLAIGNGFEFDLINTLYKVLGRQSTLGEKYLAKYSQNVDVKSLNRYREYWEIMFLAKTVGKQFQKREVPTGLVGFRQLQQRVENYGYKTVA